MITDVTQVWRARRASYRPAGEPFDPRAYEVAPIAQDAIARAFVVEHHYSGTYPAARRRFGLYQRGGALVGVVVFSVPVRAEVFAPMPREAWSACAELGRLVLLDTVQSNAESWFVRRCLDALTREGFAGVVSFSDPFRRHALDGTVVHAGHIGGVYQALGARYVGRARPGAMLLLPDGRSLSPRAVAKIRAGHRGREYAAAQLVAAGAPPLDGDPGTWVDTALEQVTRRVRHPGNLKYAWPFGRATAKAVGEGLPYVKLCDVGLCAGARMHRPTCARAA